MEQIEKKDHENQKPHKMDADYFKKQDYLSDAVSTTDCTGILFKPAEDDYEAKCYDKMYEYLPSKNEH